MSIQYTEPVFEPTTNYEHELSPITTRPGKF